MAKPASYKSMDDVSAGLRDLLCQPCADAGDEQSKSKVGSGGGTGMHSDKAKLDYSVDEAVEYFGCGRFQIRVIAISGILNAADAMEMMLLTVLGPALRCDWQLSDGQVAALTTFVFVGMLIGAPAWGLVADKFGRRVVLLVSSALIAYFGALCSVAPNYAWVLALRCLVGFNIGGAAQSYTLLSEFLPQSARVIASISNMLCWCAGGIFLVLVAWAILPGLGWRWLTAVAALPLALALPAMLFLLPESLRFLLASNQEAEASRVMELIARENGRSPPPGKLASQMATDSSKRGHVMQLLHSSLRRTSLTLLPIWFSVAFTYYGVVLLSSDVTSFKQRCLWAAESMTSSQGGPPDTSCCRTLDSNDYKSILLSSIGEFAILPLNLILLDRIGRRPTAALHFAATSIFIGLVAACVPAWATTGFLFVARGCAAALFNLCYLYTAEVYPTSVRSLGIGLSSAASRIGAMLTPLVAQVLLPQVSVGLAFAIFVGVNLACCCLALSLPVETLGRPMQQFVEEFDPDSPAADPGTVNEKTE